MTKKLAIYIAIMMLLSVIIAVGYILSGGHIIAGIAYPLVIAILLWIGVRIGLK